MAQRGGQAQGQDNIFRIAPYYFIHVLDQNTNVTKIEIGPQTYIRQDNERLATITDFGFGYLEHIEVTSTMKSEPHYVNLQV